MTDRELLELAAKAAGYSIREWAMPDFYSHRVGEVAYIGGEGEWNPLTDDGDALRLAVKLGLVVDCSRPSAGLPFYSHEHAESATEDRHEATRRAIVRAAAEIGKAMP